MIRDDTEAGFADPGAPWWRFLALLCLWIPASVWLALVLRPYASVPLVLAIAALVSRRLPDRAGAGAFRSQLRRSALPFGLFALGWSALTGLPGVFHVNGDWYVRLDVLHVFAHPGWMDYADGPRRYLLRFPGAYYALVAPLAGHLSMGASRVLLWGFTAAVAAAGLAAIFHAGLRLALPFLAAAFATNGLDLVGVLALDHRLPAPGAHVEPWSGHQYSGLTTGMVWVPNHLLPALLFVATLPLCERAATLERLELAALAAAGTVLWSPLVFAGTLPILVAMAVPLLDRRHAAVIGRRLLPFWLPLAAVSLAEVLYVTYFTASTRHGWALSFCREPGHACGVRMAWFYALEAAPLAAQCLLLPHRRIGVACAATLLVLPQIYFGPSSDLEMRGSFPAILVAAVGLCAFAERRAQRWIVAPVAALLLLQSYSALSEVTRAVADFHQLPWRSPGLDETFRAHFPGNLVGGYPPHYMIPVSEACGGSLGRALRGCEGRR